MLLIVHNNRAYHRSICVFSRPSPPARPRQLPILRHGITITDPNVDYATIARGFGVHGEGPITDPNDLAPALERAIAVVKSGQPALIDVVTDPR